MTLESPYCRMASISARLKCINLDTSALYFHSSSQPISSTCHLIGVACGSTIHRLQSSPRHYKSSEVCLHARTVRYGACLVEARTSQDCQRLTCAKRKVKSAFAVQLGDRIPWLLLSTGDQDPLFPENRLTKAATSMRDVIPQFAGKVTVVVSGRPISMFCCRKRTAGIEPCASISRVCWRDHFSPTCTDFVSSGSSA